jgi:dTDP-4-dehydrorhamnose reductase
LAPRLQADKGLSGTYHLAGAGETSWHGFARAIVARQMLYTGRNPAVMPIAAADYPTDARRPSNSVLDSTCFAASFGYAARPWHVRVEETVDVVFRSPATSSAA